MTLFIVYTVVFQEDFNRPNYFGYLKDHSNDKNVYQQVEEFLYGVVYLWSGMCELH